jgi:hypothetical protein
MKPQSAKAKGRRLQQKVANSILDTFPELQPADCFSTSMGCPGEDIKLSTAARALVPLSLECKNTERLNLWGALDQCTQNCPSFAEPCVVFSKNNAKTYATVEWNFLLKLLRRSSGGAAAVQSDATAEEATEAPVVSAELQSLINEIAKFSK